MLLYNEKGNFLSQYFIDPCEDEGQNKWGMGFNWPWKGKVLSYVSRGLKLIYHAFLVIAF